MPTPAEREFQTYRRGEIREAILLDFREGLRLLDDSNTGEPFAEETIRRVTARGSRFYREADALDVVLLGQQKRGEFLAQQVRIDRANSAFLRNYHATTWGESFLPESGGSGSVLATGTPGTIWQGSTAIPDPLAVRGTDPAGRRYQVVASAEANSNGQATVQLVAIDGGEETNVEADTEITWSNPPAGSAPTASVIADFSGGLAAETDADFATRLVARIRHKPASGNWSHLRTFARDASVSVEDAFVYPCAFHAGSVLIAVVGKRGGTAGPSGRVPSVGTLADVTAAVVPPGSPSVPGRAHVVVVPIVVESSDLVLQIDQAEGSATGWTDAEPFPASSTAATITTLTSQTDFRITASAAGLLPGGVSGPLEGVSLMVWNDGASAFESLAVDTVQDLGGGEYRILLDIAPSKTLVLADYISPDMSRRSVLAGGVVSYFDSLGPGEVIDLDADVRGARAYRNPVPNEEAPARAGQTLITFVFEAMGSSVTDAALVSIGTATPSIPSDPIDGPNLLVPGKLGVYPLAA